MTKHDNGFIGKHYSEKVEVTDWRLRIHWFSWYTDSKTQMSSTTWIASPDVDESNQNRTDICTNPSYLNSHIIIIHTTNAYLSLSTLLKPGRMCLKLELRSSLGWLFVRFIDPFSLRLRKPCWTNTEMVGKAEPCLVCAGSFLYVYY